MARRSFPTRMTQAETEKKIVRLGSTVPSVDPTCCLRTGAESCGGWVTGGLPLSRRQDASVRPSVRPSVPSPQSQKNTYMFSSSAPMYLPPFLPPPQAAATLPKTSVLAPSLAMLRAALVILTMGRVMEPDRKYTAAATATRVQHATIAVVMMICDRGATQKGRERGGSVTYL